MATNPNTPYRWVLDWIARQQAARARANGLDTGAAVPFAPPAAPGAAVTPEGAATEPPGTAGPPPGYAGPGAAPGAVDTYDTTYPYPESTTDALERYENARKKIENDIHEIALILSNPRADPLDKQDAQKRLDALDRDYRQALDRIATETNRRRDDARTEAERARQQAERDKAEELKRDTTPRNGDTRTGRDTYTQPNGQTVRGVFTETYENGVWKYVPGSAKREEGFAGQPQGVADKGTPGTVLTDGQGGYWMVDPYTGTTKALNGPAAAVKTVTDPDGSVYLQKPDGSKGSKLFDSLPGTYTTPDGRVVGYDKRTGQQAFSIDTQTPEGRALADRLQRATVEAAELANQPKFGGAQAQLASEATRRQGLAEKELKRLTDLQKSGQISPDQAKAQFDRWMQLNVEGPLAGFKAAAEAEHRTQEQENLTRTTAEQNRVDVLNRQREQLAYEAGEAGRQEAIELGRGTRATEYISDLGGLANRLSRGPMGGPGAEAPFQFSAGAFDPANFRKVVPNVNELASAAVDRLLARVSPATARNVNVPLPALPAGGDLRSMMDQVRYSGPLSAPPAGEVPEIGAMDLKDLGQPGRARTVYSNSRYYDWDIPQTGGAVAQVAPAAPPAGLPGQLPGETAEERLARFYAIR